MYLSLKSTLLLFSVLSVIGKGNIWVEHVDLRSEDTSSQSAPSKYDYWLFYNSPLGSVHVPVSAVSMSRSAWLQDLRLCAAAARSSAGGQRSTEAGSGVRSYCGFSGRSFLVPVVCEVWAGERMDISTARNSEDGGMQHPSAVPAKCPRSGEVKRRLSLQTQARLTTQRRAIQNITHSLTTCFYVSDFSTYAFTRLAWSVLQKAHAVTANSATLDKFTSLLLSRG